MAQIDKPNTHFNTVAYSGTGVNPTSITSVGFQPDFLWIKSRSDAFSHLLFDAVRGVDKRLISNSTSAESTEATISSFDTNGWTMDSDTANNGSGKTYVGWNWKAGGTAVSNTDGSITSSVSANTTSGFSIVSYTGTGSTATIGHGLGAIPKMIIVKNRDSAQHWQVYHIATGNTKSSQLSGSGVPDTASTYWNDTSPTSTVFSIGTGTPTNGSTNNIIAYCFADVKGFSKFGSYVGNGSTDGTFVYTGFKPAFFILKRTDSAAGWYMIDNKRGNNFNVIDKYLQPNTSSSEQTTTFADFVSNGVKLKTSSGDLNASGGNFIYMAFAENPLVGTNGVPATAR